MKPAPDTSQLLLNRFCAGEPAAGQEIFDRYVARLLQLVRRRMSPQLQRRVDPEDVVQSALRSFFVRASAESYVLRRAGDLWRLLVAITLSKLRRQVEVHTATKRAIGNEYSQEFAASQPVALDRDPLPEEQTALIDELQRVIQTCRPDERAALELRLAGETVESIAETMRRSQRTVRRLLQACREELERRLLNDEPVSENP